MIKAWIVKLIFMDQPDYEAITFEDPNLSDDELIVKESGVFMTADDLQKLWDKGGESRDTGYYLEDYLKTLGIELE